MIDGVLNRINVSESIFLPRKTVKMFFFWVKLSLNLMIIMMKLMIIIWKALSFNKWQSEIGQNA